MDNQWLDDIALEHEIKAVFGMSIEIDKIIVHGVDVSRAARASVILTKKKQLLCYIKGHSRLLLADISKVVSRMGLRAELYIPPKGRPNYFDDIGKEHFRSVFPGRKPATELDIAYYRTLAPYNPGLVIINEVKDGTIYQFDSDAKGNWRPSAKFAYRRIKTS